MFCVINSDVVFTLCVMCSKKVFSSLNRRERREEHLVCFVHCFWCLISEATSQAAHQNLLHTFMSSNQTPEAVQASFFCSRTLSWVPSLFDGSDQISDLWITGMTVPAPEVRRASLSSPNYAVWPWKPRILLLANSTVQPRGSVEVCSSVCCSGSVHELLTVCCVPDLLERVYEEDSLASGLVVIIIIIVFYKNE